MYFESLAARFLEKRSAKSTYLQKMKVEVLSVFKGPIWACQKGWTFRLRLELIRKAIWTKKVSSFKFRAAITNVFFPICSTRLMVKKALTIVYNLYLSFCFMKLTLTLLKVKKIIPKATFILILANRNISSKNQDFASVLTIKKQAITISKVLSLLFSIFWAPILVFQI